MSKFSCPKISALILMCREENISLTLLDFFLYEYLRKLYSGAEADTLSAKTIMTDATTVSLIQIFRRISKCHNYVNMTALLKNYST